MFLKLPSFELDFQLTSHASDLGYGALLEQEFEDIYRIIIFYSYIFHYIHHYIASYYFKCYTKVQENYLTRVVKHRHCGRKLVIFLWQNLLFTQITNKLPGSLIKKTRIRD